MVFLSSQAVAGNTPISPEAVKMNATLDQNQGGVVEGKRNRPDWAERINVSGLINVDATIQSRTPGFRSESQGESWNYNSKYLDYFGDHNHSSATDLTLADADLFVDATVNDWVSTHVALLYRDNDGLQALRQFRKDNEFDPKDFKMHTQWSHGRDHDNDIRVDEAYFTIGCLERNPFYLRAGRLYVPFGSYQRYSVSDSLTKLLSMTSETVLQIGAVSDTGWSGALYTFRGINRDDHDHDEPSGKIRIRNWGAQVAYARDMGDMTYNVGVGYLNNMADVDFIRTGLNNHFDDSIPALSVHGDVVFGPFDVGFRYVTALDEFSPSDISFRDDGANPSAYSLDAGYSFETRDRHSRLAVTYQHSDEAKNLGPLVQGLPEHRWGVDYQINLMSRTDLDFEIIRDTDYGHEDGGTGKDITVGTIRLSVAFA